ncbi:unnamed protein product [Phaedon cochleariae]|uniref:DM13 domain-containing protein n=1 Tax=Phaedon cochleariae TaxID=80249 RepID=A0A9N9X407_PHACE|nr:unnamed protein product [Phaedon cochleariae]
MVTWHDIYCGHYDQVELFDKTTFHEDNAKFWVGRGPKPSPQGVRVPDENGKETPLRRYDGKTVVLTLPGDLTVFDIGHFGVWCEQFTVDFGHVTIPQGLNAPPSLRMLGVSPQKVQQHRQDTIQNKVSRPLVGGHLQPTTFRPPSPFSSISRRNDYQPQQYITQQEVVLAQNQVDQAYRARALALENIPAQQLYHQQPPLNHIQPHIQQYQAQAQHRLDVRHQPQVELQPFNQQQIHSQSGDLVQLQHQPISQHRIHQLGNQIQSQYQLINQVQQPQINNLHAQSQLNGVSSQPSYIQQSRQAQNHPQINQPSNQILDSNTQTNRFFQQQIVNVSPQQQQQQPSNLASVNQRQYQEQLAYDQYLQARRHQEEEYLRNQLSRQHNRFDSPSHQNFNLYG